MKLDNVTITHLNEVKANSLIVLNEMYVNEEEKICSNKKVIDIYDLIKHTNEIVEQNKKLSNIIVNISNKLNDIKNLNVSEILERLDKIENIISDNILE